MQTGVYAGLVRRKSFAMTGQATCDQSACDRAQLMMWVLGFLIGGLLGWTVGKTIGK